MTDDSMAEPEHPRQGAGPDSSPPAAVLIAAALFAAVPFAGAPLPAALFAVI